MQPTPIFIPNPADRLIDMFAEVLVEMVVEEVEKKTER